MRLYEKALLVLILVGLTLVEAGGQTVSQDFEEPLSKGWQAVYGAWEAGDGVLTVLRCQEGGNHLRSRSAVGGSLPLGAIALFGKPRWENYEVRVTVEGGTDVANLLFRVRDTANYIQFGRYGAKLVLYTFNEGRPVIVAQHDKVAEWPETLSGTISGTRFSGYVNGELVIRHDFLTDEIPLYGKTGIQTNHPGAKFDDFSVIVYTASEKAEAGTVDIGQISVSSQSCGLKRILVCCGSRSGPMAVAGVYLNASVVRDAKKTAIPAEPLVRTRVLSATEAVWEGDLFSLHEGEHIICVQAYDLDDRLYEKTLAIPVSASEGTYATCGDSKLFEFIDPHPVWRGLVDHTPRSSHEAEVLSNYLWHILWAPDGVVCRAFTLEPQPPSREDCAFRISTHDMPVRVFPEILDAVGNPIPATVHRRLGDVTSMFCVQPTYEIETPLGTLVWGADVWVGDPILRFRGKFYSIADAEVGLRYIVSGFSKAVHWYLPRFGEQPFEERAVSGNAEDILAGSQPELAHNFIVWRPETAEGGGPVFAVAFDRQPSHVAFEKDGRLVVSQRHSVKKGEAWELPMVSLIVVDAFTDYADLRPAFEVARLLAHASLAVPSERAAYTDIGLGPNNTFSVALRRDYVFRDNDWGLDDTGQFISIPWCAGDNTEPKPTGWIHTAFGRRAFVLAKEDELMLRLPLPDLSEDKLTPAYLPLTGDWLGKAADCVEYIHSQQNDDGTFRGYERMDHYSLARMTLGLMAAYGGFENRLELQHTIGGMVRRALARMMGEKQITVQEEMQIDKAFSTGVDKIAWREGEIYEPFAYLPKWGVYTEMGSLVDQNLGHAHLIFTLLLYGAYVDPLYLRSPEIQQKIQEFIKFQWLSQDWNGDIWRVYVGGADAAGGGDGFEEDLAMVLPVLAERAGLEEGWVKLAYRIAAMKYGALREFDYLALDNEWGLEFLTPMHHPTEWAPEGGWNLEYRGDIWWTGPSVCSGYYGPWYVDSVYRPIPEVFRHQWYRLLEDQRDVIPIDGRHWLTIGGYCSEARLFDPFLGAAKLLRAYRVAKERGFLTSETTGEHIWNFCFYPAAMTVINHELLMRYDFMKAYEAVEGGADSGDPDHFPVCCWKGKDSAVIAVAGHRIREPQDVQLHLDTRRLGLSSDSRTITNVATGEVIDTLPRDMLTVRVKPHSATVLSIRTSS